MAYTTPKTWSTGNTLTAADMNTYVRDNVAWLATDKPSAKVYKSTTQAITTATLTLLTFDLEQWDVGAMHSTVTNTSRLTVPTAGKYLIGATVPWAVGSTGYRGVRLNKNGVTMMRITQSAAANVSEMEVSYMDQANAADYYEVMVEHSQGSTLNVDPGFSICSFWAMVMRT